MRKETTICWIKIDGREVDILAELAIGKGWVGGGGGGSFNVWQKIVVNLYYSCSMDKYED
jgi:hypothetical protein